MLLDMSPGLVSAVGPDADGTQALPPFPAADAMMNAVTPKMLERMDQWPRRRPANQAQPVAVTAQPAGWWPALGRRIRRLLTALLLCATPPVHAQVQDALAAAGLVDVAALVPDIALDLRYAGPDNFVGTRIDGYNAPRCLLRRPVAEALARVERTRRAQQQRLLIFDCYRPQRAVAHFMRWASDLDEQSTRARYYPRVDKSALVPDYIAEQSGHSRADTVDLTLLQCDASLQRCVPLDMGTPFDFFDPRANTDSPEVSDAQRAARHQLRQAMTAEGFGNYPLEWWHYSLRDPGQPIVYFDLPIEAER